MKTTALFLTLCAASWSASADEVRPLSPSPQPTGTVRRTADEIHLVAQNRPAEAERPPARGNPEPSPPGGPNPPPPPGRGDAFGKDRGGERDGNARSSSHSSAGMFRMEPRNRVARPVIVTSRPLPAEEQARVEEDLGIMARLLEKEIERETGAAGTPNALGIPLITRVDHRGPAVLLLEGYGAVFTFQVRLPLLPPPARKVEKQPERPADSPWERTRRELFGPPDGGGREGDFGRRGGEGWPERPAAAYDAKRVEGLKQVLLASLKHAANIRQLKSDDYVTIVVQGSGGNDSAEFFMESRTMTSTSVNGERPRVETSIRREGGEGTRAGLLTLRAKKSDAADFAAGKVSPEEFARRIVVNLN